MASQSQNKSQRNNNGAVTNAIHRQNKSMFYPARIVRRFRASPTVVVLDLYVTLSSSASASKYTRNGNSAKNNNIQTTTAFEPGQWIDFVVPGYDWVGGFSPSSSPRDMPMLRIAVKRSRQAPVEWIHSDHLSVVDVQVSDDDNDSYGYNYNNNDGGDATNINSKDLRSGMEVKIRFGGKCTLLPLVGSESSILSSSVSVSIANSTDSNARDRLEHVRPTVFCAGGIGISPILSQYREFVHQRQMLAAAEATPSSFPKSVVYNLAPVRFLYTVSTEDELVYGDELGTLSSPYRRHDQMVFALTKADQWDDKGSTATDFPHIERRNGRVLKNFLDDSLLQGRESGAGATPVYYICGPRSMIDDAVSHLKSKNVSDDLIRYEKWW